MCDTRSYIITDLAEPHSRPYGDTIKHSEWASHPTAVIETFVIAITRTDCHAHGCAFVLPQCKPVGGPDVVAIDVSFGSPQPGPIPRSISIANISANFTSIINSVKFT